MKKTTLTSIILLFSLSIFSQTVSFTDQSNLLGVGPSGHSCVVDMNNDYLDDVVRVSASENKLYIDFQQANGTFSQQIFDFDIQNDPNWSIAAGDVNADGKNDLVLGNGSRVSFIISDGTSYYEDYHNEYIFSQGSTFADIDNDGNLDAFVCHDVDQSHPYRNDGSGNMTLDQSLIETLDLAGNYSAIWVDYDNDRDIDLYITKCRQGSTSGDPERTNAMYSNNGDGTFTEVGALLGLDDNSQSWSTTFQDFDNDGDMDAFIVNHDFTNSFMLNEVNENGKFTEMINFTNIDPFDLGAWEVAGADFNNDGYVDILSELSNELHINNKDLTFTGYDLPFDEGGIGDLNDDGFLDVVYHSTSLYMNDGNSNNWSKVNLRGLQSNRNGIGARVEIETPSNIQIRDVRAGESFSPMSSLNTHFGIGADTQITRITVYWPSGVVDNLTDPAINQTVYIEEGGTSIGVNEQYLSDLVIYPIPTSDKLNIGTTENLENHIISVFDNNGKRVLNSRYESDIFDVSQLSKGLYFLQIEHKGKKLIQKFIKE